MRLLNPIINETVKEKLSTVEFEIGATTSVICFFFFFSFVSSVCQMSNHKSPNFTSAIFQSWAHENKRTARASTMCTNYKNNISSSSSSSFSKRFFRQRVQQNNRGINFRFISRSRLSFFSCDT